MARRIAFVLTVAIVMDRPHRAVAVELADCAVHCDVELARLRAELAQARGDCTIMQRRIDALEVELRHSESDRHDRSAAAGPLLAFAPFCTRRRASKKRVPFSRRESMATRRASRHAAVGRALACTRCLAQWRAEDAGLDRLGYGSVRTARFLRSADSALQTRASIRTTAHATLRVRTAPSETTTTAGPSP